MKTVNLWEQAAATRPNYGKKYLPDPGTRVRWFKLEGQGCSISFAETGEAESDPVYVRSFNGRLENEYCSCVPRAEAREIYRRCLNAGLTLVN